MRCYQEMGLTGAAEVFLDQNCEMEPLLCQHCGGTVTTKRKVLSSEHKDSFYDDGPILHTYQLKDGRIAKEIVQAEPWSSGPVCFMCLEMDGVKMFEWDQEEIDNA